MMRIDLLWLTPGASDLRGGIDRLLALVVRGTRTLAHRTDLFTDATRGPRHAADAA